MSPRRSGFWSSVKRALGGAEPEETRDTPAFLDLVVSSPPRSSSGAPEPAIPAAPIPSAPSPVAARPQPGDPPFLGTDPISGSAADEGRADEKTGTDPIFGSAADEGRAESRTGSVPEPATESPALARNLASFSSRNSERGKRFAHLLKDSPPPEKPAPGSDRRR